MTPANDRPLATATSSLSVDPLLVDKPWTLCGISRAHWCRLEVAGKTPAAIRLGRKKLYRRRDLALWVDWGCPARNELEIRMRLDRRLEIRG